MGVRLLRWRGEPEARKDDDEEVPRVFSMRGAFTIGFATRTAF